MTKIPIDTRVLNLEQKKAVKFGDGPLLVIAGAGTGKTTVVTERIKFLLSSGKARPDQILALTFTEKASREMEERVDVALPYGSTQMWISTFHAFCDRVLRNDAIHIGLNPAFKLMSEAEAIMFFRSHLFEFHLEYFRPLGNPTKFISGILQHFSRLKDEDIAPNQYLDWLKSQIPNLKTQTNSKLKNQNSKENIEEIEKYLELADAYKRYEELKVKEGVADYADLISHTLQLFRIRKNILLQYQKMFKYILIDEFQDTNFAQNELAVLLAGAKKNITVVGDDDQAIYRWRGAAVSNIIQFRKRFPKAKIIVLTKNYRSTKEILDRSYDLIQHNNPDRLEIVEKIDKKLESMRRINGERVEVIYTERVEEEAEEVAKLVQSLKVKVQSDGTHYDWKDFAILVRANNHAEPFARALRRAGIPYQFLGPGQLFRQPEVKDLIAYLKILYNFEDNIAFFRVLSMEWVAISARDIAALINHARKYGRSIFEVCENITNQESVRMNSEEHITISDTTRSNLANVVSMIHRHLALVKKETAGQILYYFLEDSGLLKQMATHTSTKEEHTSENIVKFFNKIKTYETEHEDASVFAVVDWIDLSMNLGESPSATDTDWSENDAVHIMTIHSAKGLEFPVVFLVNLVSARFPTTVRREQIPIPDQLIKEILPVGDYHLEEERRLFYVGMTRARDRLFFTAALFYGEGKREKKISPFVSEATGNSLIDVRPQAAVASKQLPLLDWQKLEESSESSPVRQPITFLSYSQMETFHTCPLQYKYRYILKIPVPPSAALTFGDTMHRTIKSFYESIKTGVKPTEELLYNLLEKNWSSVGYKDKTYENKMKIHGKELLRGYLKHGYDPSTIPMDMEQSFQIRIHPSFKFGGRIDRVDMHADGTLEIIDYKTGQATKIRNPQTDPQLTVYALAATDKGVYNKPPEKVIVSFYFFESQEKISGTRTKIQLDAAREDIAKKADEISRSDFRPTPGKHCDYCEFRLVCEAWK